MSRRPHVLTLVTGIALAFAFGGCGSRVVSKNRQQQQGNGGSLTPGGDPDQGNDPNADDPEQPTRDAGSGGNPDSGSGSDSGPGNDGGGAPGACDARPRGWRSMASAPGVTRFAEFMDASWTGSEMFLLDTWTDHCSSTGCLDHAEARAYDPATDSWRMLPAPPFANQRPFFDVVVFGGGHWMLWSGHKASPPSTAPTHGYAFDVASGTWSTIPTAPLGEGGAATGVWSPATHEMIVALGEFISSDGMTIDDLSSGAAYDPVAGTWRRIADAPIAGQSAASVWSGDRMVVAFPSSSKGGDALIPAGVAASYDPVADVWTALSAPPGTPRIWSSTAAIGPMGVDAAFYSGWPSIEDGDYPNLHDGVYWTGTAWRTLPDPGLYPSMNYIRDAFASWSANGRFYVWGGSVFDLDGGATDIYPRDGAIFDPSTGAWSKMPAAGPTGRGVAVTVWTGCDAIVYGGWNNTQGNMNDGMTFRP